MWVMDRVLFDYLYSSTRISCLEVSLSVGNGKGLFLTPYIGVPGYPLSECSSVSVRERASV